MSLCTLTLFPRLPVGPDVQPCDSAPDDGVHTGALDGSFQKTVLETAGARLLLLGGLCSVTRPERQMCGESHSHFHPGRGRLHPQEAATCRKKPVSPRARSRTGLPLSILYAREEYASPLSLTAFVGVSLTHSNAAESDLSKCGDQPVGGEDILRGKRGKTRTTTLDCIALQNSLPQGMRADLGVPRNLGCLHCSPWSLAEGAGQPRTTRNGRYRIRCHGQEKGRPISSSNRVGAFSGHRMGQVEWEGALHSLIVGTSDCLSVLKDSPSKTLGLSKPARRPSFNSSIGAPGLRAGRWRGFPASASPKAGLSLPQGPTIEQDDGPQPRGIMDPKGQGPVPSYWGTA